MCEWITATEDTVCEGPDFWPDERRKKPKPHSVKKGSTVFLAKPPKKKNNRNMCPDCAMLFKRAKPSEVLNAKLRDWVS